MVGGTGFMGSHLVRRLVTEGAEVHLLVRPTSSTVRLDDVIGRVRVHQGDLLDYSSLHQVARAVRPLKIFHLGAYTSVERSFTRATEMAQVIFGGAINLLHALDGTGYDCFVYVGTCEEYGDNPVPFREDQVPNPVSPYSVAKAAGTLFCQMASRSLGCPCVILRPFLTYGPFQDLNRFIPQAIVAGLRGEAFKMTAGEQGRELNYIDDIIEGFIRAVTSPEAIGEIINLGSGVQYRIRELVEMVFRLVQSPVAPAIGALPYRPVESWDFYCDNSKAKRILGWESQVPLEEGLRRTVEWYRETMGSGLWPT